MAETQNLDDQQLLTTAEAAKFIRVSIRTLYRYEEQGRIRPERLPSGVRRWRRVDLEALLMRGSAA
jgi:excisionase family DNA binding protein